VRRDSDALANRDSIDFTPPGVIEGLGVRFRERLSQGGAKSRKMLGRPVGQFSAFTQAHPLDPAGARHRPARGARGRHRREEAKLSAISSDR
jgi:hypothetical protein